MSRGAAPARRALRDFHIRTAHSSYRGPPTACASQLPPDAEVVKSASVRFPRRGAVRPVVHDQEPEASRRRQPPPVSRSPAEIVERIQVCGPRRSSTLARSSRVLVQSRARTRIKTHAVIVPRYSKTRRLIRVAAITPGEPASTGSCHRSQTRLRRCRRRPSPPRSGCRGKYSNFYSQRRVRPSGYTYRRLRVLPLPSALGGTEDGVTV